MGHVGDQLHLHPLAAGLLLQGALEALLDVVQVVGGLGEVTALLQGEEVLQIPGADGGNLVGERADVRPDSPQAAAEIGQIAEHQQRRQADDPAEPPQVVTAGPRRQGDRAQQYRHEEHHPTRQAADPLLQGVLEAPGGEHGAHAVPPWCLVIPPVVDEEEVYRPEQGEEPASALKEVGEELPEAPPILPQGPSDGHTALGDGCRRLHEHLAKIAAAADGKAQRGDQQQLHLPPELPGEAGRCPVGAGLVAAEEPIEAQQQQSRAQLHSAEAETAAGLLHALAEPVELVGPAVVAVVPLSGDEHLGLGDGGHGDGDLPAVLAQGEVLVAGDVPIAVLGVVAIAVDIHRAAVFGDGDLLPVEVEVEIVVSPRLGDVIVRVGVEQLSAVLHPVEQVLVRVPPAVELVAVDGGGPRHGLGSAAGTAPSTVPNQAPVGGGILLDIGLDLKVSVVVAVAVPVPAGTA